MTTQTMAADKPATLRTSDAAKTATSGRRALVRGPRAGPPRRRTRSWPSATQEPRPRGPLLGPAVSLRVARLGDHIGRMEKLSLDALSRELIKAASAAAAGRSARTVYGGHEHVLRQTLMALTAGSSMSEHENPGEATVHVLLLRGRPKSVISQASELYERKIGITPFDCPREYMLGCGWLLTPWSGKGATVTC
jgi:hypothetical protein